MFVVPETWKFWIDVPLKHPDNTTATMQACFAIPSNLSWDGFLELKPQEALEKLLIDWKNVVDHNGCNIDFQQQARRKRILSLPFVYQAMVVALLKAIEGDVEKN